MKQFVLGIFIVDQFLLFALHIQRQLCLVVWFWNQMMKNLQTQKEQH